MKTKNTLAKYFSYNFKKKLLEMVILTVISLLIILTITPTNIEGDRVTERDFPIFTFSFLVCALFSITPVLETYEFKNKRNLDTLLSFPLSRFKISVVHFINGFLRATTAYSISFLICYIYVKLSTDIFALEYLLPYYFQSLVCGLIIYSFFIFIFNQANTIADGVILCLVWYFLPMLLIYSFKILTTRVQISGYDELLGYNIIFKHRIFPNVSHINTYWNNIFSPIANLSGYFEILIEKSKYIENIEVYDDAMKNSYMFAVCGFIGIASAIGYFFTSSSKQFEKAGEKCQSVLGYKLIIPLCGYSILIGPNEPIILILTLILMFIGYVIYQRSIKLKKHHYLLLTLAVVAFVFGSLKDSGMLW